LPAVSYEYGMLRTVFRFILEDALRALSSMSRVRDNRRAIYISKKETSGPSLSIVIIVVKLTTFLLHPETSMYPIMSTITVSVMFAYLFSNRCPDDRWTNPVIRNCKLLTDRDSALLYSTSFS
jgi:hypothetical protein